MEGMKQPDMNKLRLGTSAWSNQSWVGVFYPVGTKPADYLARYAEKFDCVEIDSTFYRAPTAALIKKWAGDTPAGFQFAAKVPQRITHEKVLVDCREELSDFLRAMDGLGDKLGPLLLQFPYFNKSVFPSGKEFLERLRPFLNTLPRAYRWAVEIRNKSWIQTPFLDLLRENRIAFTLIDQSWMPAIDQILKAHDPLTTDFVYLRWLGDRKGVEAITTSWDKVVVDRTRDLERWVQPVRSFLPKVQVVYGFFNNHYSGHAPASLEQFRSLLAENPPAF
jgi:uncharacterized protein YecE (DUF72 family)